MKIVKTRFRELLAQKARDENRRNIPLAEVARETGVTWKTIRGWDEGQVTRYDAPLLIKLCTYFNCTIGDLLYIELGEDWKLVSK